MYLLSVFLWYYSPFTQPPLRNHLLRYYPHLLNVDVIDEWSRSISRFRGNRYLIARSVKKHAVALGAAAAENVNFIAAFSLFP